MHFIDLRAGGASWEGWHFGPFGRARDWRIHAPDGASYTAGEIAELRQHVYEIDYLTARVRQLGEQIDAAAVYISRENVRTIRSAIAALDAALPPQKWARQSTLPGPNKNVSIRTKRRSSRQRPTAAAIIARLPAPSNN